MKFDEPATTNPIDQLRYVGNPLDRVDGPLKTTGTARYAYERHDAVEHPAYGYIVGSGISKGRIASIDITGARSAPGVLAVVPAENAGELGKADRNTAKLLGGPDIQHYHQAIALVVAESFEQARAASRLVHVTYERAPGAFDLASARTSATRPPKLIAGPSDSRVGDFTAAFESAPVQIDATYTTSDESHAMMEPHTTMARWDGDTLTLWTSTQMVAWLVADLAKTLKIPKEKIRVHSPFIGGGFGGKLFARADAVLAALGARASKRAVKLALHRPLVINNTTHRPATIQRMRIGASTDGRILAIAHECWSGNLPGGSADGAVDQTRMMYAGKDRLTATRLAVLDLPESNAMRAPGEATGHMALEVAMDELAETLGLDPVDCRVLNDTQTVPDDSGHPGGQDPQKQKEKRKQDGESHPGRPFSQRSLVECLRVGSQRFGWDNRSARPRGARDGNWLIGMGMASAYRGNLVAKSGARVKLDNRGCVTVETDMTDIGTGSYTIIAQTAAEMLGVPLACVNVELGDSAHPVSAGSGGQFGGNCSTAGVYAACMKLREAIAATLGFNAEESTFANGAVSSDGETVSLGEVAADGEIVVEDTIEFGSISQEKKQATFGAHFVEVAVDAATYEVRVRRMLAVCACGRILNPKTAR
ncbi:MAG TPA: xanthine dehydrogenase family protein molybdopterin-binding subunit, partial [Gemmatimonadaceae bacterium]|nr:xanthine dehydrogenase family protein molybdopterin-binding subunit [Gemmatimonadaceae bacterium]